ncbi:DUF862-domain-containing protein [Calocera viscosa TUFC12733]|uniref:DUF862-domain-containing protein n=1 Tax=Calocera viscosa (strain TUFC12733) TaxID=1330018 RepID=A0A167RXI5_CALVF|nr:DUF862-domain-containing protein [Calocera viscosa TUFC12733]
MSKVQLYVYDLSNGMARSMSLQLTGRQIDGIWHTSVVVFGKEVFYGQGISIVHPGTSHHGRPLQVVDMGTTQIDEETFMDYLGEMRSHYTADKYHLLDFNCNSFTNDVVGFLTGGAIPPFIKDLPADFLSTPLGAALRPTIDNMYRRGPPTAPPTPAPQAAASLLSSVASQAAGPSAPLAATSTLTAPLQLATNPASLRSLLQAHEAATVLFTAPATCAPCRIVDPVFERLAHEKAAEGLAFVKVDLDVGLGRAAAAEWGVTATPTVIFFSQGKKMGEVKGANIPEITTQVDLLLYELYPPHPHTQMKLPTIRAISLNPILFSQIPDLTLAMSKFASFIDAAPAPGVDKQKTKNLLQQRVLPLLDPSKNAAIDSTKLSPILQEWSSATVELATALPPAQLFPLVDFWRIALLSGPVSLALAGSPSFTAGLTSLLSLAYTLGHSAPRPFLLTSLRLAANLVAHDELSRLLLLSNDKQRQELVTWLVDALLSDDAAVRTATASVTFNLAASQQRTVREAALKRTRQPEDADWVVEMVSALVEALDREVASEEVVHRLAASLALFVYLSPVYAGQLADLLEVLQAKRMLLGKLEPGGCGEKGVQKKEVRALVRELADNLCP